MTHDTPLVSSVVIEHCKGVLIGLKSLVDVGGGTGTITKAIAQALPQINCILFVLPHVIEGLEKSKNLIYMGGDMFISVPSADTILLKATQSAS
ncbi:putative bidirectional sugar transporter SWEET14-like [Capsicum annuum]|nr:putative bidirectional sugar transporter SWEET14-like [Capsicum annuum]KAF3685707.1 putative bidirectional sugar transporter SWEET14-like [Capsicum annuum]